MVYEDSVFFLILRNIFHYLYLCFANIIRTKVHIVKALVFLVVMYRHESWTIKKTECQRIDAFKLWCWRRLLRVPLTARRLNQSILKEINLKTHWKD